MAMLGKGTWYKTKAESLVDAVTSPDLFNGKCRDLVLDYAELIIKKSSPYTKPELLARVMNKG